MVNRCSNPVISAFANRDRILEFGSSRVIAGYKLEALIILVKVKVESDSIIKKVSGDGGDFIMVQDVDNFRVRVLESSLYIFEIFGIIDNANSRYIFNSISESNNLFIIKRPLTIFAAKLVA